MKNFMTTHWLNIPGGQALLAEGGYLSQPTVFDVAPFAMARYPVTNAQYAQFIAAGGYTNPAWWPGDAWSIKEKGQWAEPRYWHSRDWNRPDYPVVGVSWYEALAFCRWLSQAAGHTITLPTEQQWQRAAQGDDGRAYPWGNQDPNETLCNWNRHIDETTPVTQYPAGASPYQVMDMSGNVWEWLLTSWASGATEPDGRQARLLRGGSWSSDSPLSLRATNRNSQDPNTRLNPLDRNLVTVSFRYARLGW
jgi:formylglycine-generating enzyme required for sulfatase activity